jgi:hypothetical protein
MGNSTLYPDYVRLHLAKRPGEQNGIEIEGVISPPYRGYDRFGVSMGNTSENPTQGSVPTLWLGQSEDTSDSIPVGFRPYHMANRVIDSLDLKKFWDTWQQNQAS